MVSLVIASEEARFAAMSRNDLDALEDLLEDDLQLFNATSYVALL